MTGIGRPHFGRRFSAIALGIFLLTAGCSATEPQPGPSSSGKGSSGSSPSGPASSISASSKSASSDLPASVTRTGAYHPAGADSFADQPDYYTDGCRFTTQSAPPRPGVCEYGDLAGAPVAIVGDSKVGQWMPALQRIAAVEGWRLLFYSRSGCPFAVEGVPADCSSFVQGVADRLRSGGRNRLLIASQIAHAPEVIASETQLLTQLTATTGTRVVLIADNPQPGRTQIPTCLAAARDYWLDCALRKNDGSGTPALRQVADAVPDARFISLSDVICPTERHCPAVLNRIALFRAGSHLTKSFVEAITPTLHARLIAAGVAKGPVLS